MLLLCDVNKPVARMLISILCEYATMHITQTHFTTCDWFESTKTNPITLRWLLLKIDKICGHIRWSRFWCRSMATLSSAVTIEHRESRIFNYIYLCSQPLSLTNCDTNWSQTVPINCYIASDSVYFSLSAGCL